MARSSETGSRWEPVFLCAYAGAVTADTENTGRAGDGLGVPCVRVCDAPKDSGYRSEKVRVLPRERENTDSMFPTLSIAREVRMYLPRRRRLAGIA